MTPKTAITPLLALMAVLAGCATPAPPTGTSHETTAPGTTTAETTAAFACNPPAGAREPIKQDGSSTVFPVAQAWAETFSRCVGLQMSVSFSGTGGGFQKFCRGEIQISDASRPIKQSERDACAGAGIEPYEIQVAIDGLAIVVDKDNTFVDHLTVSELNRMWTAVASKQANTWSDIRSGWPAQPIELWGPGTDSGTFDYFVEVIIHPFDGSSGANAKGRSDYNPSEDDNVLLSGVSRSPHALGYFGLAYVDASLVRPVPIVQDTTDGGKTTVADAQPVPPTPENIEDGKYKPLARPIFMYTDGKPTGRLAEYFKLGLGDAGQDIVASQKVGYIRLPEDVQAEMLAKVS
jgi:phosphate transport system substrate-binding protein